MFPARVHFAPLLAASAGAWIVVVACSSSTTPEGPACANESSDVPFGASGVLPLRALPTGRPCASSSVCGATIDDCPNDWPDGAAAPLTSTATPYQCTCPGGVWTCVATTSGAPSCAGAADAGSIDGAAD